VYTFEKYLLCDTFIIFFKIPVVCELFWEESKQINKINVFFSECGRPPMMNRIVGGYSASEGAWPWQVDIQVRMAWIMKVKLLKTWESLFTAYIPVAQTVEKQRDLIRTVTIHLKQNHHHFIFCFVPHTLLYIIWHIKVKCNAASGKRRLPWAVL